MLHKSLNVFRLFCSNQGKEGGRERGREGVREGGRGVREEGREEGRDRDGGRELTAWTCNSKELYSGCQHASGFNIIPACSMFNMHT